MMAGQALVAACQAAGECYHSNGRVAYRPRVGSHVRLLGRQVESRVSPDVFSKPKLLVLASSNKDRSFRGDIVAFKQLVSWE